MANASINDFGNNQGLLYITQNNGVKFINSGVPNDSSGVDLIKRDALNRAPIGYSTTPYATLEFTSITGNGDLFNLTINGIVIISGPIAVTIGNEDIAAQDTAADITSFFPSSGPNYIASANGNTVYIYPALPVGDSINGYAANFSTSYSGNTNSTDMDGGQDGNELVSSINGLRYWMDANYGATGCSGAGTAVEGDISNAIEITNYVIKRGLETGIYEEDHTVDANLKLEDFVRGGALQYIKLTNPGATDLEFIPTEFSALGDILYLYGDGFAATVKDESVATAGNILTSSQSEFIITDNTDILALKFTADAVLGNVWVEMFRSKDGVAAGAVDTAELANLAVTTAKLALLAVDDTILAADSVITSKILNLNVTTAKIDDLAVTTGKINALAVTTAKLALLAVDSTILDDDAVLTAKILDGNVTLAKLEADLQIITFFAPVSFETGFTGQVKVEVPFACDVTKVSIAVTKLIEATDDATVIPKNHAGTAMTDGQVDLTASAPIGNVFTSSPTNNNSLAANENIILETSKVTAGGEGWVTIHAIRT